MDTVAHTPRQPARFRWTLGAGIGLALMVLAITIAWSQLSFRDRIRAQIAQRDGLILDSVAAMQHLDDRTSGETLAPLDDPGEQFELALKISRLKNVLGVRLFSVDGKFVNAFPFYIAEATLPEQDLARLRTLKPVSHFNTQARLAEQVLPAETNSPPVPLLSVNIPLRSEDQQRLVGVVQFLMDGTSIAQQYAALDRSLWQEAALAFLGGGGILAAGLALAFRRVQLANRLLADRTDNLLQANRELALAAKTSAVGAVTSHLIHGLKNPLSGLQTFVRSRSTGDGDEGNTDWQLAVATTERMQDLINQVVRVLQAQPGVADYEITLAELEKMLTDKTRPAAEAAGVRLESAVSAEGALSNREADLVLLILQNLMQNAIEATPRGKKVRLTIATEGSRWAMEVRDEGPGLSPEVAARLFTPCASAKKGGSGLGLAISHQLAKHLGAELGLKRNSPEGCSFRLVLPSETSARIAHDPATSIGPHQLQPRSGQLPIGN